MNRISSSIAVITLLLATSLKAQVDPIEGSTTGFAGYIYRLYSPESASPEIASPSYYFYMDPLKAEMIMRNTLSPTSSH